MPREHDLRGAIDFIKISYIIWAGLNTASTCRYYRVKAFKMVIFSRIISIVRLMCIGCLSIGLLSCNDAEPLAVGSNVSFQYKPPTDYWAHRAQQQFFSVEDGRIAYTDTGPREGPVLVLLHGVPTSSWMFRKIIPGLQERVRVISVDHLGFGSSDKPEDLSEIYTRQEHADRVTALLSHLGIEQYSLLMHDMGGLIAWELMRRDMDNIEHLIVLNTVVSVTGFNHPNIQPSDMTREMMRVYSGDITSTAMVRKTFSDLGLTGSERLSENECFGYVQPLREGADGALYAFFISVDNALFTWLEGNKSEFANYDGDVLVLWGANDTVLTTRQIPILQDMFQIPDENINIYEDHAHFVAEEIPEEIIAQTMQFLK